MTKKTATVADASIHSRALLVWLTISTWSARKYDRKISDEVNAKYAATSDAGRYNKFLLPGDAVAYKSLVTISTGIRHAHYAHTLAWSDEGWRLLPTANYMDYTTWFREQQSAFQTSLTEFTAAYPAMRAQAKSLLTGMYRDEDYPSPQDMQARFALDVKYSPLPNFGDVRVDLADDQVAAIEADIASRINDSVAVAVKDAWARLYTSVERIHERLADPAAIFRDSLIENARDVCNALQRLNVTQDPKLDAMRQRVQTELTAFEPDILRDTPRVRAKVADQANKIMQSMAQFYQPEAQ